MIFPIGEPTAYAQYLLVTVIPCSVSREQVNILTLLLNRQLSRINWHIHRATKGGGQMLIGVAGRGWYQEEGKPAVETCLTVIHWLLPM